MKKLALVTLIISVTSTCSGMVSFAQFVKKNCGNIAGYYLIAHDLTATGYGAYRNYVLAQHIARLKAEKLATAQEQNSSQESLDQKVAMVNALAEQIGIDASKNSVVLLDEPLNSNASTITTIPAIFFNKDFFKIPSEQQKAILAHECIHIKHNDTKSTIMFDFASPFIATVVCWAAAWGLKKMHGHAPSLLQSPLFHFGIAKLLQAQYSQYQEKRADIEAAQLTGTGKDHQAFMRGRAEQHAKLMHQIESRPLGGILAPMLRIFNTVFLPHPSWQRRITYLQSYI